MKRLLMYLIDPEVHGDALARVAAAGRKLAMGVVGTGVAAGAGLQLVPLYGAAIGMVATAVATVSGVAAAAMLLPRVGRRRLSSALAQKSADERAAMGNVIETALASIHDSEVRAVVRHSTGRLHELAGRASDDVETQQFVLINMQSLAAIAEAFSASGNVPGGGDATADVIETVCRIGKAANGRIADIRAAAAGPLAVELAVSNRLIDEERKRT